QVTPRYGATGFNETIRIPEVSPVEAFEMFTHATPGTARQGEVMLRNVLPTLRHSLEVFRITRNLIELCNGGQVPEELIGFSIADSLQIIATCRNRDNVRTRSGFHSFHHRFSQLEVAVVAGDFKQFHYRIKDDGSRNAVARSVFSDIALSFTKGGDEQFTDFLSGVQVLGFLQEVMYLDQAERHTTQVPRVPRPAMRGLGISESHT